MHVTADWLHSAMERQAEALVEAAGPFSPVPGVSVNRYLLLGAAESIRALLAEVERLTAVLAQHGARPPA